MTAYLRWLVCNPADEREVDAHGAFMRSTPPIEPWAPSALEHYPLHWYVHVMHAFEVVGYRHPVSAQRAASGEIYERMVEALHLRSESRPQMIERLSEDRIALGAVTPVAS
jgi:hypothetical protein